MSSIQYGESEFYERLIQSNNFTKLFNLQKHMDIQVQKHIESLRHMIKKIFTTIHCSQTPIPTHKKGENIIKTHEMCGREMPDHHANLK